MAFRVKVSRSAKTDADDAFTWMREHHSEERAIRWFNGLVDAVNSLAELPRRCPLAPESEEIGIELRQLLYGKRTATYRIIFAIVRDAISSDEIVQVFCVRHGAREWLTIRDLDDT